MKNTVIKSTKANVEKGHKNTTTLEEILVVKHKKANEFIKKVKFIF